MADSTSSRTRAATIGDDRIVGVLGEILIEIRTLTGALQKIMPLVDTPAGKWALARKLHR